MASLVNPRPLMVLMSEKHPRAAPVAGAVEFVVPLVGAVAFELKIPIMFAEPHVDVESPEQGVEHNAQATLEPAF